MVHELDGMFAFCVVDRGRRETFIARDALGIKPLYLRHVRGRIVFASEMAALRRYPAPRPTIDPARLVDLVTLQYVPGARTVFREVVKLLPGHALHVGIGPGEPSAGSSSRGVADLWRRSTTWRRSCGLCRARSAQAAGPLLGVFLVGSPRDRGAAAAAALKRVLSFPSTGGGVEHDERRFATLASRALGTEHHELVVHADDVAALPRR